MVDWTDLPHEIFISIFIHLFKKQDIAQCQITCQHWRKAAEEVFLVQHCSYLEIVDTCHNPEPLWQLLREFHCWKYIKEIPKVGWDGGNLNTYFDLAIQYRETLQSLYLGDRNYFTGWDDGPKIDYLKVAARLDQFTSLTYLEIQFATTAKTVMVLETLVNACPLLTALKFTPTFYDQSRYFSIENPLINNIPTTVQPHFNLRTFEGMGVQFTSQSTRYFISKFPRLQTLFLKQFLTEQDINLGQNHKLMQLMAQHISSLKHVNVYNTLDTNTMARLMQEFLNVASLETLVQIEYDDYDIHHSGGFCYPYLIIRKKKGTKKMLLQVHFKSYTNTTSLPHLTLIENLGKTRIKNLHLNLGKKVFSCDLGSQVTYNFQKRMGRSFYQLTRCLQLQTLQLQNINLCHVQEKKCKVNKSVHTLEIAKDELDDINELEAGLEIISKYFISLKSVYFDIQQSQQSIIKIRMPYSHLQDLHWKVNKLNTLQVLLFVHEIMNSSKSYFSFTQQHDVREIPSQEFNQPLLSKQVLRLQVQCYSLKSFTVQYHPIYKQCIL
ncbi:hypothetical protein INT48_005589 [Thamnidium elegans]|uniref:F-box domain-containing protein n=1 Tax=Thamnidium elegans TaxID=101142 RepID=A0A8H7T0E2_9FUNG|nr:hypothetical protein INT48_005589 [Thamnidium elegans]